MDKFTGIVNIFSDSGISEERLKSCINELPRYEIDRLCSLVEQEIEKRGLKNHTPKDEEDLLRDFGFISCLATENQQVKINCVIEVKNRHFHSKN